MGLVGNIIESKVSDALEAALGVRISFERLDVSLGGTVDAHNVVLVANTPDANADLPPVLTIARLRADIAVTRVLKGEIVVKSIAIERPRIVAILGPPDRTNLPPKLFQPKSGEGSDAPEDAPPPVGEAADAGAEAKKRPAAKDKGGWKLDLERVLLTDGHVQVEDRRAADRGAGEPAIMTAGPINAELRPAAGPAAADRGITVVVEDIARGGASLGASPIRIEGTIAADDLARVAASAAEVSVDVGGLLRLHATTPRIAGRQVALTADGSAAVARLLALLPLPASFGATLRRLKVDGVTALTLRAAFDPARGLDVEELTLRITGATVARQPASPGPGNLLSPTTR